MTSKFLLFIRHVGRIIGINKWIGSILDSDYYERKFSRGLLDNIEKGDVVWDVGANIGLYTELFLDKVGDNGEVFAFEPSPGSIKELKNIFDGCDNVHIDNCALGELNGSANMLFDEDPTSVVNRIVEHPQIADNIQKIRVMSGDSLVKDGQYKAPNVIKIDVEGHELSVINGMSNILNSVSVRCVGIEVHFGLLRDRGEESAPKEIEKTLKRSGFKIIWTDPSHLIASR